MSDEEVLTTRKALAAKYAAKYGIATELICALVEQESGWVNWSYRYEPEFYSRYITPLGLSEQAGRFRATSWGLGQIMGQTAREFGFVGAFFSELCDPDIGLDFACKKLRSCLDKHPNNEKAALSAYNGGSNQFYADQVLARKAHYLVDVVPDGK